MWFFLCLCSPRLLLSLPNTPSFYSFCFVQDWWIYIPAICSFVMKGIDEPHSHHSLFQLYQGLTLMQKTIFWTRVGSVFPEDDDIYQKFYGKYIKMFWKLMWPFFGSLHFCCVCFENSCFQFQNFISPVLQMFVLLCWAWSLKVIQTNWTTAMVLLTMSCLHMGSLKAWNLHPPQAAKIPSVVFFNANDGD